MIIIEACLLVTAFLLQMQVICFRKGSLPLALRKVRRLHLCLTVSEAKHNAESSPENVEIPSPCLEEVLQKLPWRSNQHEEDQVEMSPTITTLECLKFP